MTTKSTIGHTWVAIPQRSERYVRDARLAWQDGAPRLHVIAWSREDGASRETHESFALDAHATSLGNAHVHAEAASLFALSCGDSPEVSAGVDVDLSAHARGQRVQIACEAGRSVVTLTRGGVEHVVFAARCTAAAPALFPTHSGTWVAFHHNLREDTAEPDLTKWIALRFVDAAGAVFEVEGPMHGLDRDAAGEEQGFEFPTLLGAQDGALALFGRGSHQMFRQDVTREGFGPRVPLGEGGWGCRGRRVALLALDADTMLTARRDKRGIVLSVESAPRGGVPPMVRATADPTAKAHRDLPHRPSSNAMDPAARRGFRTLFGDIHQHSAHSDGCGSAHEPYLRARHVYGDDFCALSDHESFLGKRIGPGEWGYLQAVAEHHNDETFSTLLAYEWTGKAYPGPGHKVVYAARSGLDVVSRDVESTGEGLLSRLREQGAFAVPHHVGWTGADIAAHDPLLQPVWEICSCHGCYLYEDHPLGQRGDLRDQMMDSILRKGLRMGFIACSDGHGLLFHHGVGRKRDSFRCGLTAVQAESCTREAILEALRQRRCYATSGVRILLDVDANGSPMGSVLRGDHLAITVRAAAGVLIREMAWIGPEGVVASTSPSSLEATFSCTSTHSWGYARVVLEDGEMAWSSPVFLEALTNESH